ncbi:MAG: tripartite tricarboxylate transporter substrate binding protein [Acetobacteraceae bacterium]|nr:tripartite tricarboxylate transporter substrate binding protein [Acetobacteraceae bacterium]
MQARRRDTLTFAAAGLGLAAAAHPARAAGFPDRPVRVIVPYGAGANSDVQARLITARMSERLGQPFVVENRAGAGGSIGADAVAKSRPDGYTLLVGSNGPLAVNPAVQARMLYDATKDFAPISLLSRTSHTIAVRADSPFRTLADLLAAAKADPGKIAMGSSGNASATHFTIEMLMAATGARVTHVPYRASSQNVADLLAGNVPTSMAEISTVLPTWRSGQTRVLAIAAAQRSALMPDVPTLRESGIDVVGASWIGLLAPAGTPREVIAALSDAVVAALSEAALRERLRELGTDLAAEAEMRPEGFAQFIREEQARTRRVAQQANIRVE